MAQHTQTPPHPSRANPARPRRRTVTERLNRERLARNLRALESEDTLDWTIERQCPDAWATLEEDVECAEPRVSLTLRLDASVAKFYRAMGPGYQRRINRILATYAQMKIVKVRAVQAEMAVYQAEFEARAKGENDETLARRIAEALQSVNGAWDVVRRE